MNRREFTKPMCSIAGCNKPTVGRGWCRRHYNRWHRLGGPEKGGTAKGALEAWIFANATHPEETCLTWPFHRKSDGIAGCTFRGRHMNAARAMCIAAHGDPPSKQHDAAHSCGKAHEGCVNPRHLSWKTKAANQADRELHGTTLWGERNPAAKLSDEATAELLSLKGTDTHEAIARRFGISRQHVGSLFSGHRRARA